MKSNLIKGLVLLLFCSVLSSCWSDDYSREFPEGEVLGYKPIYSSSIDRNVVLEPPRTFISPGKIYVKNDYLFLNEQLEGIHIIDNSDPTAPQNIAFLRVHGSTDMAIRNGVMYVNQFNDLLAISISDVNNPTLVSREDGILESPSLNLTPPEFGFYFECIDSSKGYVIGWEKTTIENPKCYK